MFIIIRQRLQPGSQRLIVWKPFNQRILVSFKIQFLMLISNKRRFQDRQLDNRRLPRRWRTDPLSFLLWERFANGNKGIGDLSSVFVFFFIPLSRDKYAFLAPFSPNSQETQRQICHYRMVSQAHHPWKESIGESKLVPSPPVPTPPPTQLTTKKKRENEIAHTMNAVYCSL